MDILILGGTRFLGRHLVEAAVGRGHQVTLFHRGKTNPGIFPDLEHILGDRNHDLQRLADRRWQAVIDTSGYFPKNVRESAQALRSAVKQYVFISSISVYDDLSEPGTDESAAVATIADPTVEEITDESYGALKALCERAVQEKFPNEHIIIRPGLIVGRYDPTDRFTYWAWRVALGGEVLAPIGPDWPVQIIDAVDLAAWTILQIEKQIHGTYNAVGPQKPFDFGTILEVSRQVSGATAAWTWVSPEFLRAHEVEPWRELPLWLDGEESKGAMQVDNQAALQAGLTFRSLEQTVRDTLAWVEDRMDQDSLRAGLSRGREAALLEAWHREQKS